ncbi:MAG: hypothetical protein CMH56_16720 [Myxococcales bacterium]|nr:hypothetical protein [Myxococcales bacterium]
MSIVHMSKDQLNEVLGVIELREFKLLKWGIVDAAFTKDELLQSITNYLDANPLDLDIQVEEIFAELLKKGLIVETPNNLYRSRMAETVRVLSSLRQWFRRSSSQQSRPLVMDYRLEQRPRKRPRRDLQKNDVLNELNSKISQSATKETLKAITPDTISGFQKRSIEKVLDALATLEDRTVMITAGTGSGKTNGFYLPGLSWLSKYVNKSRSQDDVTPTRILCLYPRKELLKDQLANLLKMTRQLHQEGNLKRPVRISPYFGDVPQSYKWKPNWKERKADGVIKGYICPFLSCISDDCGGNYLWKEVDRAGHSEQLTCEKCGDVITEEFLSITREGARERGVDILLATTEMLNRVLADPKEREVFGVNPQKSLRLVLLDEVHTYEGLSGAQNAYLMRRLRHAAETPLVWVGLSATLESADEFIERFTNTTRYQTQVVEPFEEEMEETGAEYLIALRHHPGYRTGVLSTTIQASMAIGRSLDYDLENEAGWNLPTAHSDGIYGTRTFIFSDKLDVMNRLYWSLLDAEGWANPYGALRRGEPKSLAHLRSEAQGKLEEALREAPQSRDTDGQWWWMGELLGHGLDQDTPLRVGRTYSADAGVGDHELVVATASLEVGYDDDRVGAVIQHRAPHDPAQFLQRKGRAGRDMQMRPWTIVVLSGFGRDRIQWQLYDQLFSPTLKRLSLPMSNRYVQRLQAVYATLDWLSIQSMGHGGPYQNSTWTDLAGPWERLHKKEIAQDLQKNRQKKIKQVISKVLEGAEERTELRNHLLESLSLGFPQEEHTHADVEAILWTPPRSLLLSVLPTIKRRITHQWEYEIPDDKRIRLRSPLPDYIPGNLFDDLMTPEVTVLVPTNRQNEAHDSESLPALRSLRELMPGNVTRHYGLNQASNRHWIPVGDNDSINIEEIYAAKFTEEILSQETGKRISLYRPTEITLEIAPSDILDSSYVSPDWQVALTPIGEGTQRIFPETNWAEFMHNITFHTHRKGSTVRIRRFSETASGTIAYRGERGYELVSRNFEDNQGNPVALGIDLDVDGLKVTCNINPQQIPEPSSLERTDWMHHYSRHADKFSNEVTVFDKENLVTALQLVLVDLGANAARKFTELSDTEVNEKMSLAITKLEESVASPTPDIEIPDDDSEDAEESNGNTRSQKVQDLISLCRDTDNITALRELAEISWSQIRNDEWLGWTKKRIAATFASFFLESVQRICEQVDIAQLSVDLQLSEEEEDVVNIWITETVPGGNGYIELIEKNFDDDPNRFMDIFEFSLKETELETLDEQLQIFLNELIENPNMQEKAAKLTQAWEEGHESVSRAFTRVRSELEGNGITLSTMANTTAQARLLGPGTHPELPSLLKYVANKWDSSEKLHNIVIDPEVISIHCLDAPNLNDILQIDPATSDSRKANILTGILWPRSDVAGQIDHEIENSFGLLPKTDPKMFRAFFPERRKPETIKLEDISESAGLKNAFHESSKLCVKGQPQEISQMRNQILRSQLEAVDAGLVMAFPRLTAIKMNSDYISVDYTLEEKVQT